MHARKLEVGSVGRWGYFVVGLGVAALGSCSGDDTTSQGATGAAGSSVTAGSAGAGGSATGQGGSAGAGTGGAGGGGTMVNGCDSTTAVDKTASGATTVTFSDLQVYDPACIRIKAGSSVTWSGNFVLHPLEGGTVNGSAKMPDPASPIKLTAGADAGSVTFNFPSAGTFGYYCTLHAAFGMKGAVFVTP